MFYDAEDFYLTAGFTKNLLLKRFELSSPQAKQIDSPIFYPFSQRATQSTVN